jgi:hypothetical protein
MENRQFNKDHLFMRLMSGNVCGEIRDQFPCDDVLNLTVGYRWLEEQEDGIRTSQPLRIEQLEENGLKKEELLSLAKHNTGELFKTRLYKLEELVRRICEGVDAKDYMEGEGELDKSELYVCTNDSGMFGAAVMFIDSVIEKIAKRLGCNLYILPSSIHEVIIVPRVEQYDLNMLKETVRAVNSTVVNENDFLSDSVYQYDLKTSTVEIAM